jgi:Uma2 family endonuclease
MLNSLPIISNVPTEKWVAAEWAEFLGFADDPSLAKGRFYYDQGRMRIEMLPVGMAQSRDHALISHLVMLYATLKRIPTIELTNTRLRQPQCYGAQPDITFYIESDTHLLPHPHAPVTVDDSVAPSLVVEIADATLADDQYRKRQLYQRMGVREYWVVDVRGREVFTYSLTTTSCEEILESLALPGLEMSLVETVLERALSEEDATIKAWLLAQFGG